MNEKVSIIVPVYRAAPYIAETIEMVRRQTYRDWELLFIDDCSPDNSAEIIQHTIEKLAGQAADERQIPQACPDMTQRIRLIRKAQNEGAARARNTGLEQAEGRYIAFLDADDIWLADKLTRELAFMEEQQAGFVFGAYEFGDEAGQPTGKVVHVPPRLTYQKALSRTVIFTTTVVIDRNKIPEALIRMPAVPSEDTATWWQILRAGYVAYGLDEILAVYRRPAKSLSSNKLTAIKRIWYLYRKQERLSVAASAFYFVFWAYRATVRRI